MFKKSRLEVSLLRRTILRHHNCSLAFQSPRTRQSSTAQAWSRVEYEPRPSTFIVLSPKEQDTQLELDNGADVFRRIFLGPNAVYRSRSINQRMYDFHFETPDKLKENRERGYQNATQTQEQEQGEWVPKYHRLRDISSVLSMDLVQSQLRSCLAPEDFSVVFTTVMQHKLGPEVMANSNVQRLLQKWLVERLDPGRVLEFLGLYITRLEAAGQTIDIGIVWSALMAAAQAHCTTAVRKYLKMWHTRRVALRRFMDEDAFVALLRALRFGYKNPSGGRSPNRNAVLEIMFGFSDPSFRGPYHLQEYLDQEDYGAVVLWNETLVDLHAGDHVWDAWNVLAKNSPDLWWKTIRQVGTEAVEARQTVYAPRFFIHCLFKTDQPERAWEVFKLAGQGIRHRDSKTWNLLLNHIQHKSGDLDPDLQGKLQKKQLAKLSHELFLLEKGLGLRWNPSVESGVEGFHIVLQPADDVPSTFEALSDSTRDVAGAPPQIAIRKIQSAGKIFHNPGKPMSKRQRTLRQRTENASRVSVSHGSVA